jgi:DNA-binding CsgD family transcriptional regulator/predicted peroxiredoxin
MRHTKIPFLNCYFLIVCCLLFSSTANAQKSKVELLRLIQQKDLSLDKKGDYLCELSTYFKKIDSVKAYSYANQALKIAQESNTKKNEAIAYEALSDVARYLDNIPLQIKFADSSLLLATQSKDEEAMAYANYAIAYKYQTIGNEEKYIYHMLKSLSYFEKYQIRYDKLVNGYENLGASFSDNKDFTVCEKYTKKALQLSYKSKNQIIIANALTSWALYLVNSAEQKTPVDTKLLHDAEIDYLKAIDIFEKDQKSGNVNLSYGRTCLNLTHLYLYHFFETKQAKTLEYLKKTEEVCIKLNVPMQLMVMYGQQAQFYTNLNDISNVEKVLKKVEEYITKNPKVNPRYFALLYKNYMDLAEIKNDFPAYRNYFNLYDKALGNMIDKENRAREYNASIRFETEKKSQEIKLLTENLESRKKINYLYIGLLIFGFFALVFMFRSYHFRQKSYIKTNLLLQKANEEANLLSKLKEEEAMIAVLESELNEKELQIAIQEKILNEQQKIKLQQELMTNNLQLEKKNEVLKDIQSKLLFIKSESPSDIKTISKTIDKSMEIDEEFELLKTSLENTNPIFFSTLQEKAIGTLTKLDFKYCGYIKLGMSTKEIANHMNIETQSMRMARYRIKQKLNLEKEVDLDTYIGSVQ